MFVLENCRAAELSEANCRTKLSRSKQWLENIRPVTLPSLWSPYVIGQTIIFLPCDFYLSIFFYLLFFFPRLISAVGDWMSTILLHMAWP